MKISIITATYNSLQHLPNVIGSIRQQTYPNIEYIVIDGGSTDGTVEYVRQSNLVSQIISEPDNGIYDALNKGIRLATGDIIGFLHSDDLFASPHTLENIVCAFTTSGILGKEKDSFRINDDQASFPPFVLSELVEEGIKGGFPEVITRMRMGGMSTGGLKNLINKKKEDYWVLKNNKMPFPLWILFAKNISKIPQLVFRKRLEH